MKKVMLVRPRRSSTTDVAVIKRREDKKTPGVGIGDVSPLKGGYIHPPSPRATEVGEKKEKPTVEFILDLTNQLTVAENQRLLASLALKQQIGSKAGGRDLDMWAQAVYDGLVAELGHEAGSGVGPLLVKRTLAVPSAWAPVTAFMASSRLQEQSVTKRQAIYMLLATLVIKNARYLTQNSGAPMSAKLIGACASNVASLFDSAFPGYLKSGLAHVVATQLTQAREPD